MSEGVCNHLTAKSPSLYHNDDILLIIPYGMYWSEVRPEDLIGKSHCVKSVRIRSFSGTHLPALGLNTEIYSVNLCILSEYGKIRTRKTQNTDTFYAVS